MINQEIRARVVASGVPASDVDAVAERLTATAREAMVLARQMYVDRAAVRVNDHDVSSEYYAPVMNRAFGRPEGPYANEDGESEYGRWATTDGAPTPWYYTSYSDVPTDDGSYSADDHLPVFRFVDTTPPPATEPDRDLAMALQADENGDRDDEDSDDDE